MSVSQYLLVIVDIEDFDNDSLPMQRRRRRGLRAASVVESLSSEMSVPATPLLPELQRLSSMREYSPNSDPWL